jgi:transposase
LDWVWQSGGVKTLSLDLRERILTSYDREEGTREAVAARYRVSLGMVKKLLQQRRRIGQIGAQHHRSGRKPMIVASHHRQLRVLLDKQADLTLKELRAATGLACSLPAIHYALAKLGLTYKKRRSAPASKTAQTSRRHGGRGGGANPASTPPGWSSSTNRARRRT